MVRTGSENIRFSEDLPTTFVGRTEEIQSLARALTAGDVKAAAIAGKTGVGKTALALMFAHLYRDSFPGGVFHLHASEFVSISDAALNGTPNSTKPLLLIVDDIHHRSDSLIEAELQHILAARPTARLLAISQVAIRPPVMGLVILLDNFAQQEVADLIYKRLGHHLDRNTIEKFYSAFLGNPLATSISSSTVRDGLFTLDELFESLKPFAKPGLVSADGRPLEFESEPYKVIVSDVTSASDELLRKLSTDPKLLYELSPRRFEEVVAELLRLQGYEVRITPASRDGGKDIYVASRDALGSFLYIVECKKQSPDNPVGVGLVRQLYGVCQAEKATAGILVTTSFFTKDASEFQRQVAYQISLQDYFGIVKWLNRAYGSS